MENIKTLSQLVTQYLDDNNEIIYDKNRYPSCFVRIDKTTMRELIGGDDDSVHPAFMVGGVEVDCIYVSKFENVIIDGVAESLPLHAPTTNISFTEAEEACQAKGKGFHLMTATESNLLALLMKKQKEKDEGVLKGNTGGSVTLTGSTPCSTVGGVNGVYDLIGNVGEFVSGLRLNEGEVQIVRDNDTAQTSYNSGINSLNWYGVKKDNSLSREGRDTYKFVVTDGTAGLNTTNKISRETAGVVSFNDLQTDYHPKRIVTNGVAPRTVEGKGKVQVDLTGERIAVRGGDAREGGVFTLDLTKTRDQKDEYTGFRCVYIPGV